ncbi:MAG: hypothetical protein Kow00120_26530 [Anaerolineae bacterium]
MLVLAVSAMAFGAALALYLLARQPPASASPTATPSLTPVTTPTPTLVVVTVPPPTRTVQRQRLIIPWLDVNTQIVEMPIRYGQWQVEGLDEHVGHLAGTAPPGSAGNAVIAGHITLPDNRYGPFADLAKLPVGSEVIVQDGAHRYVYAVESSQVVAMDDLSVVAPTDTPTLTLLTCTGWDIPLQTYVERVIVVARLVQEQ